MAANLPSTQPYLIRAIHEWCTDNGFTPHVVVQVDDRVRVPKEYVRDGRIVLNVGYEATGGLQIGNDLVSFQARFGGVARDISFPVGNVAAIYARENGAGMAFEPEGAAGSETAPASGDAPGPEPRTPPPAGRPNLRRIK
jgi:stringent starvation protein B